ncbi:MAG: hypothetical protein HON90_16210, partial [Halobacteriovoraceae bacterium]|nr:hypothetical protein [Halobacteriovoraceae bacterium]
MKNTTLKLIGLCILVTSCANKPVPQNACKVQLKEKISVFDRELVFSGQSARYTEGAGGCAFLFWGCRYTETSIDKDNNIFVEGSGLFSSKKKVGVLKKNKIIFDAHFLDSFAKVSDMEVSLKDKMVYRKVESKLIGATL